MAKIFTITAGLENMGAIRTGGQGSVYKGKRMGTILTAVKLLPTPIHAEDTADKNFRDFQNEVEKLKKVNEHPSPHVVKILNSGLTESGSLPFIEMEYIEGPDLEDLLKPPHNPVFTIREVMKLATQLAAALAHCHKVGVKHGDIKSNNVKFNTATGNYILLDFGLAVMSDEQRRSSLRNAGAVEFMAPEQYDGKMLFESDIYSYGVILFELLAGSVPFPLLNKNESARNMVMLSHIEKEIPDLMVLRNAHIPADWPEDKRAYEMQIPEWLIGLIHKCLEKKPEDRFANGEDLLETVSVGLESNHNSTASWPEILDDYKKENERLLAELQKYRPFLKFRWVWAGFALFLLCMSVFGVNAILVGMQGKETDSTTVVRQDTSPADSLKKAVTTKLPVGAKETKPDTAAQKTGPKKNKKTKDGLVDDVPYF